MPQTCDAITAALLAETGRYGGEAYRRTARKQPIIELVKANAGAWEDGMGTIISNVTTARNFPLDPVGSRTNRTESDGSTDACLPPTLTTRHGQITQAYRIRHLAVNTPEFCINDLRTEFKFAAFMGNIRKQLDDITEHVWAEWMTADYWTTAGHKLTQQIGGVTDNATAYTGAVTGMIQFGVLEDIYAEISRQGDLPFARDMDTEAPVFPLLIGREAFAHLLRENEELRQDIRWAWIGARDESPLLPNGMPRKRRSFGGYIIYENPYPRRFNGLSVTANRVTHWAESTADKGYKQTLSNSWKYADNEETIIFHPSVYQQLAVNTIGTPSPGWNFDPRSWMGEFSLRNILNKDCNPDGDKVFWRSLFADAAAPVAPEVGYVYLHKNCGFNKASTDCPVGTSSASA